MKCLKKLAVLALTAAWGADKAQGVARFFRGRWSSRSERLIEVLTVANDRAWRALEVALEGASWWDRCKSVLSSGDEKKFKRDVETFLQSAAAADAHGLTPALRREASADLKQARKAQLIPGGRLPPDELTVQAQVVAGCATPQQVLATEDGALGGLIRDLEEEGFLALAQVVGVRPSGGPPLLVLAVRYFFSQAVAADQELREMMLLQQLEGLSAAQEAGFRGLGDSLAQHGEVLARLDEGVREVRDAVERHGVAVKNAVERSNTQQVELLQMLMREMQALKKQMEERDKQGKQTPQPQPLLDTYREVIELVEHAQRDRGPSPAAPAAPAAAEQERVKTVLRRATKLVADRRDELPAFWFTLNELGREVGDGAPAAPAPTAPAPAAAPPVPGLNPLFTANLRQPSAVTPPAPPPPTVPPGFKPRANLVPKFAEQSEPPPAPEQPATEAPADDATVVGQPPSKGKLGRFKLVRRDGNGGTFGSS